MTLDESNGETGYLLGRLFALLERLQEVSRGTAGRDAPTIRNRFAAAASVTPRAVFPHLLGLKDAHEKKAKRDAPGLAHRLSRDIAMLVARLDPDCGFPNQLGLHQQGLFFIGYYQQRESSFAKAASSNDSATADDADTTGKE